MFGLLTFNPDSFKTILTVYSGICCDDCGELLLVLDIGHVICVQYSLFLVIGRVSCSEDACTGGFLFSASSFGDFGELLDPVLCTGDVCCTDVIFWS